jgi:Uma2 family endonuclease
LLVEVVSPGDSALQLAKKVQDYLGAGVRLVWVVYPDVEIVEVHRISGRGDVLRADDTLAGEDILPGFAVKVADLFPE